MLTKNISNTQINTEDKVYMYVGSWQKTLGGNDGGGGISVFELNKADGSFKYLMSYEDKMAVGSIVIAPSKNVLFAVNETKLFSDTTSFGGSVSAFSIDPRTGLLSLINRKPTFGAFPCSVTIDPTESYIIVANYGSEDRIFQSVKSSDGRYKLVNIPDEASIALIPIDKDGRLEDVSDLVKHTRISGIDPIRQSAPHPHSVNFDPSGKFVAVCDRGGDTITIYNLDKSKAKLSLIQEMNADAGTGPRNLAFSPTMPYFYISSELLPKATSFLFNEDSGLFSKINMVSTIPSNYTPRNPDDFYSCTHPSDITVHPNEKYIYVLNRGHNSIARLAVDNLKGEISYIDTTPSEGEGPRAMGFDPSGKYLYVGNQGTGNIVVFEVDANNGKLKSTGFVGYSNRPAVIRFFSPTIGK